MNVRRRTLVYDLRQPDTNGKRFHLLELFDSLRVGDTLKLLAEHDPHSLYRQLLLERRGEFLWDAAQEAPREWVARVQKLR